MGMFAGMILDPGGLLAWLMIGLIAGWLATALIGGGGYGLIGDIVLGMIGALAGGFLLGFFVHGTEGFWGSVLIAFFGASMLIGLSRYLPLAGKRVE